MRCCAVLLLFTTHYQPGVADLQRGDTEDARAKTYALLLADTVVVQPGGGGPEVVTAGAPKSWKAASYILADEQVLDCCTEKSSLRVKRSSVGEA